MNFGSFNEPQPTTKEGPTDTDQEHVKKDREPAITAITRIEGKTSDAKREAIFAHHTQNVLDKRFSIEENEREKTPEELAMIELAGQNVNHLRAKYNLPPISVDPSRIKMLTTDFADNERHIAGHIPYDQVERFGNFTRGGGRFCSIQHELIHAGGYSALQYCDKKDVISSYRSGLQTFSRTLNEEGEMESLLFPLNEAITEENARRYTLAIPKDNALLGVITGTREGGFQKLHELHLRNPKEVPNPLIMGDEILQIEDTERGLAVHTAGYSEERQAMWKLFDKIYEKNPDAFPEQTNTQAREIMFEMATKGAITGKMLPLGRLINTTFGNGTFKKYGHLKTAQEVVTLLDSLDVLK